jgi:S1-C subfamily serine protease
MIGNSVVKVIALQENSRMSLGSGVVIAPNQVATNCHVTRTAHDITVLKNSLKHPVVAQSIAVELDLCLLHLSHLNLPALAQVDVKTVNVGDAVLAYGYPNAIGISLRRGRVTKLHPFRDSFIIETDIGIRDGASGGGLFNKHGELIGLTTFYRKDLGGRYYAIPADWLATVLQRKARPVAPFLGKPFWQIPKLLNLD